MIINMKGSRNVLRNLHRGPCSITLSVKLIGIVKLFFVNPVIPAFSGKIHIFETQMIMAWTEVK